LSLVHLTMICACLAIAVVSDAESRRSDVQVVMTQSFKRPICSGYQQTLRLLEVAFQAQHQFTRRQLRFNLRRDSPLLGRIPLLIG
jgi:hypothetical protein